MVPRLSGTLMPNVDGVAKLQVEDEPWVDDDEEPWIDDDEEPSVDDDEKPSVDDDEDNIPIDSFYQRSDSEDSIGDTFFPGYDLEGVPIVESETYPDTPPWSPGEDFCAIEELKKLLPGAFGEQQISWWKKGWSVNVDIQSIYFATLLFISIFIYLGMGLHIPLQFSMQLVLIRVAMQFQDRIWRFKGRRLQWHTLTEKVRLERPLPMLGVEALYLIPMISAWCAWEGVTVVFPPINAWKPIGWFLRFCLEEFLTAHWCDIIDDIFIDSTKYHKYLMQDLINEHGKVETCRLPVDTMFVALFISRWILERMVAFKLILASHIQLLALLIVCWDSLGFILWRWDGYLLSMPMRLATYEFCGVSDDEKPASLEVEGDE